MRSPTGFTLVEVLVALLLFEFAMLALSAASATAARDLAAARSLQRAGSIARNRVERLAGTRCPAPGAGDTAPAAGLREHWTVRGLGPARVVSDSVVLRNGRGDERFVIARAATLCVP